MSFIGKNIKKIRAVKKMSQQDFAQLFNLARPSVGAYEEGRAEPKIDTVIQIANYFELSIDTLLIKELTVNELVKFDIFKEEFQRSDNYKAQQQNKDEIREQTPLVNLDKHLEYIVNYKSKDFVNNLPVIQFPYTEAKKSRAFQIHGSEMENGNCGIQHKDILLCMPVDDLQALEVNQLYVLVTPGAIKARRFKENKPDEKLEFKADNVSYGHLLIAKEEIYELWKAVALFSNNLKTPSFIEERVARLEAQVKQLLK